jgi:hypothetical protein
VNHTHIRVNLDSGVTIIVLSEHEEIDWDNFSIDDVLAVRVIIDRKDPLKR